MAARVWVRSEHRRRGIFTVTGEILKVLRSDFGDTFHDKISEYDLKCVK